MEPAMSGTVPSSWGSEAGGTGAQLARRSARSLPAAASDVPGFSRFKGKHASPACDVGLGAHGGDVAQPCRVGDGASHQGTRQHRGDGSDQEASLLNSRSDVSNSTYSVFENYF